MEESLQYIFGIRAVIEAIKAGKNIDKILLKKGLQGELYHELMEFIKENGINTQLVPIEKLNRITRKNHQGVIAFISQIEFSDIANLVQQVFEKGKNPLFLILDQITDTRNMGAIARSAECAGVDGIVIPLKGSAQITPDSIKTSAGALHTMPVCRVDNLQKTIRFLQDSGIQIVAATEKAVSTYFSVDMSKPTAIIMGAEDKGISPELLRIADELVIIPMQGTIASLNVSAAASILVFEAVRQRILQKPD